MMRRAWMAWGVALALIAAMGASCEKPDGGANGSADSTSAGGEGASIAESTAAAGGDTAAQAPPDTLYLYSYAERRGMRLFQHYCAVCHGASGQGDGFNAYNLDPRPRDLTDPKYQNAISDATLKEVVTQGGRGMNKSILMPAYGKTLSAEQIDEVVAYVRTLAGPQAGSASPQNP